MAKDRPSVGQLFGPPPEMPHTNLFEPRTCPADGGPCRCGRWGTGLRVILPNTFVRSDQRRAELNQQYDQELLSTDDPERVLEIKNRRTNASDNCPRNRKLN